MQQFTYTIQDEVGLHARPAGVLVKEAKKFKSDIVITNAENGKKADAKKIMSVMGLGARHGATIQLTFTGEDEQTACDSISACLKENL